jgi:hypothetical protein
MSKFDLVGYIGIGDNDANKDNKHLSCCGSQMAPPATYIGSGDNDADDVNKHL